jgi:hypothetical protein
LPCGNITYIPNASTDVVICARHLRRKVETPSGTRLPLIELIEQQQAHHFTTQTIRKNHSKRKGRVTQMTTKYGQFYATWPAGKPKQLCGTPNSLLFLFKSKKLPKRYYIKMSNH